MDKFWIDSAPGNFSDAARWVPDFPNSNDVANWDGGGTGTCTLDGGFLVGGVLRTAAHTGGVLVGTGSLTIVGSADFGNDAVPTWVSDGGPTAGGLTLSGTGTVAGKIASSVYIDGVYTGDLLVSGSLSQYLLALGGSHDGPLYLNQDASVGTFSGTIKPNIQVQNSGAGSQLPSAFSYPSIALTSNGSKVVFTGNEIPTVGLLITSLASTVVAPTAGLIITNALTLNAGITWVKGQGSIAFDGPSASLATNLSDPSFERLEVISGTLMLSVIFTGTTAEGLYIRSGATVNLNATTITLADPADGAFFIEAGGAVLGAGSTITCQVGDMNGVGPGGTLDLDSATDFTINASQSLTARFATMRNCVAGVTPGIAYDSIDLGGNTGWTFVTTPPVVPGTKLYLRTDNSVAPHTVPGAEFNKLLLPILAGTPTDQSMSTGILGNDNSGYGFSAAMNNAIWESGSTAVRVNVTNGDSDVSTRVRIARVNSLGVVQQTTGYSGTVTMSTGIKNFTVPTITWTAGATSDVMRVEYEVDDGALAQTIQIGLNNADTYVETPVIMHVSATGTPIQLLMGHAA